MSGNSGKRYTAELKRDAVELVLSTGRTPTEVARELGASAEGLRSWVKQAKIDRGQGPAGALTRALSTCRDGGLLMVCQVAVGLVADLVQPAVGRVGGPDSGVARTTGSAAVSTFSEVRTASSRLPQVVPSPGTSVSNCMVLPPPGRSSNRIRWT
ncbi:transposase [Streptomyces broussonetiae]|uniref:Transposase n=1 Tax=Streptomyces broussonetiae TaxID=2686304 RepID=A0A6I6MX92_9ACTN|nr:transposase [Streptomyces broussonetiae]